jgi:FHA domain
MPDHARGADVRLVRGDGLVARRGDEIVFSPSGDARIVEAFLAAPAGEAIDAVTARVEADPDAVDGFVAVQWAGRMRVAVYGDVEIASDHRSLPRLSGTGAGTWVERSLSIDAPVLLRCGTGPAVASTSLVEGVVTAGGFEVTAAPLSAPSGHGDPRPEAGRDFAPAHAGTARVRAHVAAFEALSETEGAPEGAHEPPVTRASAPRPAAPVASDGSARLIACAACLSPMPVDASDCPACGQPVRQEGVVRWRIVFDDGRVEAVDRTLVLGRHPTADDATSRPVVLDCELVSASHLEVRETGAGLHLTDLGSHNSTFVLTTGDAQFVPIEAGRAHRVDDGTVVQLGRQRFTVVRVEDGSGKAAAAQ